MQFVLMILRLVLAVLFPSSRDGLSLAARPDGRVEHVRHGAWDWLFGRGADRGAALRGRTGSNRFALSQRAPQVRAGGAAPARPAGQHQGEA